jgi:hypothetical protein
MRYLIKLTIFTLFLGAFHLSWAKNGFSSITGKEIRNACNIAVQVLENKFKPDNLKSTDQAEYDLSMCSNYINAVNDTLYFQAGVTSGVIENKYADIKMPYCLPNNESFINSIKIVLKYIKENPNTLNVHAPIVIYAAFKTFYPCK